MATDIYIGRQPIYDRKLQLIGYELLFRDSNENRAVISDATLATSEVIVNSCLEIGMNRLVGDRLAYLNIPRDFIVNHAQIALPHQNVVIEVLEDVTGDADVLEGLADLKSKGYVIALDDFVLNSDNSALIGFADLIKVDIRAHNASSLTVAVKELRKYQTRLLAEKVETEEEFQHCLELGFDEFQGYFLSKPQIVQGRKIAKNKLNLLKLMATLQNPEVSVDEQETVISRDVALSYSLLRYINSAAFGLSKKVSSVRQAVMYLGYQNIRKWATILTLSQMNDCPTPLLLTSMIRAHLCESIAAELNCKQKDACFTTGLFSALDAITKTPMDEILANLPLSQDITAALAKHEGDIGKILELSLNWEQSAWDKIKTPLIDQKRMNELYLNAIEYGEKTFSEITNAA